MEQLRARDPAAVAVVESALIFEVERDARARGESDGVLADWRNRFDHVIVVTAPDDVKVARYAGRIAAPGPARESALHDARVRLARQVPDAEKAAGADFVIENTGDLDALRARVHSVWQELKTESNKPPSRGSLE
jgi:dephospho-CoA kinase